MAPLRQLTLALALGACAQTYSPPEIAEPPAPPLSSCANADDAALCLLRLGMLDPTGYDQPEYGVYLELPDPAEIPPIRAALAFGLEIPETEGGRVAVERALMEALRLDAAGAAPEAALASIAALQDSDRPSMEPGGAEFRAYIELAAWISPFAANRPSPALARLALQRAEQIALDDPQIEAQPYLIATIANAYGFAGLSEEGLAFVRRSNRASEPGVIMLTGALDAAEAAALSMQTTGCASAARAEELSVIAFSAQLQGDAAREIRLLNAVLDEALTALAVCPSARIAFPALSRLAQLDNAEAARRAARRLEPFSGHWDALQAQRDVYEALKDDAQICRIANEQAALPTLDGQILSYVVAGQSHCVPALQAWQDASLPEFIRLGRGVDAGVPIEDLERFATQFTDSRLEYAIQSAVGALLESGRTADADRLAAIYVRMNPSAALDGFTNSYGDASWRALMHRAIAPNLLELLLLPAQAESPSGRDRPASAGDQERARRMAAAVLEYELEMGLRTLPN